MFFNNMQTIMLKFIGIFNICIIFRQISKMKPAILLLILFLLFAATEGIIEQTYNANVRTCVNFGPNYYRTFDGLEFIFGGRCTYTLAMDSLNSDPIWHVQSQVVNCETFSTCRKVAIFNWLKYIESKSIKQKIYISYV